MGDEVEHYQVQYFDISDIGDEKYVEIVNQKVKDLKE